MPALLRDRSGSTTVEFAIVGMLFLTTLLFTMVVAQILYFNQKLDYATGRAARDIVIGNAQSQSPPASRAAFTQALCGYLPAAMSCGDVIVNLYVVPKAAQPSGYYTYAKSDMSGLVLPSLTPGSGQFTLGNRGDYQYLQVIYPVTFLPALLSGWLGAGATYNGKAAYLLMSTAAFRVEQF
ncbi:TadE/TadG family type IV pilus assembly protein [Methylobacterium nonmethylotrophicum]|uniref:TadE/TadG family type IV pilus assembly protein n=1 Tax=Methylobacterium nonmethylotrophicum TaxID=1141884 RepID=UPI002478C922|nr:TadE/TadG family type IV pilus assembly protein [Methylobacterium nonmethylotrophicum]